MAIFDTTYSSGFLLYACILTCIVFLKLAKRNPRHSSISPQPPYIPFLGNAVIIPRKRPWLKFAEWRSSYGDIIFLNQFRRKLVILNTYDAVADLFQRRSVIYSHRAERMMAKLCGLDRAILFQDYGELTRRCRKMMSAELSVHSVSAHTKFLENEAITLCKLLLHNNMKTPMEHVRTTINKMLLMIVYGCEITSDDDLLITTAKKSMEYVGDVATPNKFIVDAIPALALLPEWFPGCGFQRTARECRETIARFTELASVEIDNYLESKSKNAYPSFVLKAIMALDGNISDDEKDNIKWSALALHGGGTDTLISLLGSFFLVMCRYPHIQQKAQSEIDAVVGRDSLPSFADRDRLPYIKRLIKELLRWSPPAPLVGHCSMVDDTYRGQNLPARSVIIANVWALGHDESIYETPQDFNPDRFLVHNDKNEKTYPDPSSYVFGFGRRSCPGLYLADSILFIVISTILSTCIISFEVDTNLEFEYTTGAVSHPPDIRCTVKRRARLYLDDIESD